MCTILGVCRLDIAGMPEVQSEVISVFSKRRLYTVAFLTMMVGRLYIGIYSL